MKKRFRILSGILCLLLLAPILMNGVSAEEQPAMEWALEDGVLWVSCRGEMLSGQMPWEDAREEITAVRFDEGVTGISAGALRGCTNLQSVSLPQSLLYIHEDAFRDCEKICWITFPETMVSIGENAFLGCRQLSTVFIPESISYIGDNAFEPTIFMNGLAGSAAEDYIKACGGSFKQLAIHELASASGNCGKSITWTLEKGKMTLEGTGEIEPEADGYYLWEHLRADITAVEIGEGITGVEADAFQHCRKLTHVTAPGNLKGLEDAFDDTVSVELLPKTDEPAELPDPVPETEPPEQTETAENPTEPESLPETLLPTAEDPTDSREVDDTLPILSVGHASALAGQQVALPVCLQGNPGIGGLNFQIDYDREQMTLTDYSCGNDDISAGDWTVGVGEGEKALWFQPDAGMVNGEILTLYFTVADNTPVGALTVTLTQVLALDEAGQPVTLEILPGAVTVRTGLSGDVNGDGMVTGADVLRLRRYLAGQSVVIEEANADINGDGKTDLADLLQLSKSLTGLG